MPMNAAPRHALTRLLAAAPLALALAACSSSAPATATSLDYTDPASEGWRLVKDQSTTPTRLVLKLMGPQGAPSRGVAFSVVAPPGFAFARFASGLPIEDTGVYELLSRDLDPNEAVAVAGAVKPGQLLTAGIFQKDRTWRAKDSGVALCRIALVLDPAAPREAGQGGRLVVKRAAIAPDDIGRVTDDPWLLDQKLKLVDIPLDVGLLFAR